MIFLVSVVQDYKARSLRWEQAVAVWRQFHCDLKDVTSWMTHAEKVLNETSGEVEFNTAKKEQKVMTYFNKSVVDLKLIRFSNELRSEK